MNSETKICPYCAEEIKAAAIVCKHCGRELPEFEELKPTKEHTEEVKTPPRQYLKTSVWGRARRIGGIIAGISIIAAFSNNYSPAFGTFLPTLGWDLFWYPLSSFLVFTLVSAGLIQLWRTIGVTSLLLLAGLGIAVFGIAYLASENNDTKTVIQPTIPLTITPTSIKINIRNTARAELTREASEARTNNSFSQLAAALSANPDCYIPGQITTGGVNVCVIGIVSNVYSSEVGLSGTFIDFASPSQLYKVDYVYIWDIHVKYSWVKVDQCIIVKGYVAEKWAEEDRPVIIMIDEELTPCSIP